MLNVWHNAYLLPLVVSIVVALSFSALALTRRQAPGAWAAALMVAGSALWSAGTIFELDAATTGSKLFWCQVEYLGIATIPYFWVIFVVQYSGLGHWVPRARQVLLALIPCATILLIWTTPHHAWMYTSTSIVRITGMDVFVISHGPWWWVHIAYSYLLTVAGIAALLPLVLRGKAAHQRQAALMVVAVLVPFIVSVLYIVGVGPLPGFDFTRFAFVVAWVVCLYALWRHGLCDLVPVARDVVMESLPDGVAVLDAQSRIVDANPAMQAIVGRSVGQLQGQTAVACLGDWFDPSMLDGAPVRVRIAEPGTATPRLFDVRATVLRARSGVDGWVLVLRDITEQQRVEDRLASLAHYDHLTGLPNRLLFYDRLAVMLARGRRYDTQTVVLFIDLDGFKEANDTYGHAVGDRLLQMVADRLRQCMREADTVARLGGDEFLVVAPDVQQADGAIGAARRVFEAFASSFVVEAHIIAIKASVGVAVSPRDGSTAEELVHNADRAMYEAKAQGKNTWRLHGRAGQLIADYVVMEGQGAKRRN